MIYNQTMHKRYFLVGYRLVLGLLALVAVLTQFSAGAQSPTFQAANFFSFFTIQSNILAALVLLIAAWGAMKNKWSTNFTLMRGAATLYMATTGIVYILLLAGHEATLQTTIPWVNIVLHYIMPVAVLLDWFIDRPPLAIPFQRALLWLLFSAYLSKIQSCARCNHRMVSVSVFEPCVSRLRRRTAYLRFYSGRRYCRSMVA